MKLLLFIAVRLKTPLRQRQEICPFGMMACAVFEIFEFQGA